MSDRPKENTLSDTSAFNKFPNKPNIVKNPLLSASVTNFDDLSSLPLLLPAAPLPPAPAPAVIQPSREPKSLVTVGQSTDIDSESLDEINLNAAPIEDLGPPPIIDTNTNPLLDPGITNDSLLSQAASSFSALPSVASSVFSTFSKRIYAGSSREQTPNIDSTNPDSHLSPLEIDPQPYIRQDTINPLQIGTAAPFYAPSSVNSNFSLTQNILPEVPVPEPPKFYAPTEVPTLSATAPPIGAAQNTYRLSAKKKLYAPIPGLSEQAQPVPTLSAINTAPASYDSAAYNYQQQQQAQEERKGGLFSLTNLVPTGVLQNITGLVQTAAGTLGQSVKSETSTQYTQQESSYLQPAFSVETNQFQQVQQAPDAHIAVAAPALYSTPYETSNQTVAANFFVPPPPVAAGYIAPPSPIPQNFATLVPQIVPSATISTESNKPPTAAASEINFFNPTDSAASAFVPPNPNISVGVTAVPQFVPPTQSPAFGVNFFNPTTQAQAQVESTPLPTHPPTQPQPPPPSAGQTSFRLQKGTRLYKSPLSTVETAPLYASPQQQQHSSVAAQPTPTFFNPFAASSSSSEIVAEAPSPKPIEVVRNFSAAQSTGKENIESVSPLQENSIPTTELFQQQTPQTTNIKGNFESGKSQIGSAAVDEHISTSKSQSQQKSAAPTLFSEPPSTNPAVFSVATLEPTQVDLTVNTQQSSTQLESVLPPLPPTLISPTQEATKHFSESPAIQLTFSSTDTLTAALSNFSLDTQPSKTQTTAHLPPPPLSAVSGSVNPYRKGLSSSTAGSVQPNLASFFTPTASVDQNASLDFNTSIQQNTIAAAPLPKPQLTSTFGIPNSGRTISTAPTNISNFFSATSTEQTADAVKEITTSPPCDFPALPSYCSPTAPQALEASETVNLLQTPTIETSIPPPIEFENVLAENTIEPESASVESVALPLVNAQQYEETYKNSFSNFFDQPRNNIQQESNIKQQPQLNNFFDSFSATNNANPVVQTSLPPGVEITDSNNSSEDQVLQNFFNNPPPKENSSGVGDLNYDLVHSGLGVRNQHTGSLTTASNVVEPPSSACSEFSELNNSTANQRVLPTQSVPIIGENTAQIITPSKIIQTLHEENSSEEENLLKQHYNDLPPEILEELKMANFLTNDKTAATSPPATTVVYTPAVKHWFYKRLVGSKHVWTPFSHYDSALLETSFTSNGEKTSIVAVEGGRYDVNIGERLKRPVYWEGEPIEVRRCSWFYKASDSKYVPYEEEAAQYLEEEYKQAAESGAWHKKIVIGRNEQVVFHGPTVIVHFQQIQNTDNWGGTTQTTSRPRVVKRDLDDFTIEQGESQRVDHLLLMVHGIGSACDLKMRSVEEVVDDFRSIAQQLVQSHYKNSTDMGVVGRVEVLPISWHSHLHSAEMGIDEKLKSITLESIPKLRNFTNDTLLDVLFYTSPTYCQKIITTVVTAMNTLYMRYRERHPEFSGGVSLAGHSLGSLILFDLLCHQQPIKEVEEQNMENPNMLYPSAENCINNDTSAPELHNVTSQQISYTVGRAGTGQPFIQYAQLVFHPKKFFALGSPIGMFVTIRGIDKLGLDFRLPTCPGFYNIFHPFDPVAYRIEALVNPDMSGIRPVLIPHHKGRKRMHLELKETMTRVGADLKQRFLDTFKNTLDSVNFLGTSRTKREAEETMEKEVDKVIAMQMEMETEQDISQTSVELPTTSARSRANSNSTTHSDTDLVEVDFPLGKLNDSKRIDYVLQEAPLEFFNEYLFALSSHVCYWDSSDTILFVMKEIYSGLGISPDSQVPQQTMTIERPNSRNSVSQSILPPTN